MSGGTLSERSHYDAFVQRSITELQRGLDLDNTSAKDGVSKAVSAVLQHPKSDAAQKVLCARFALGGDDAAYLQSGLAVLWSTVAQSAAGDDLTLAPAARTRPTPSAASGAGCCARWRPSTRRWRRTPRTTWKCW